MDGQGPIDVNGMTFGELAEAIGAVDLGRALDRILASGENSGGYHGFSNSICGQVSNSPAR